MRKLIYTIVVLVFACLQGLAQGTEFKDITLKQAMKQATKERKWIFIDCYTTWCGPCKRMAENIFPRPEVGDFFNNSVITLKKDMQTEEGKEIAEKYGVRVFPTFLILNERGEEMNRLVGGIADAKAFLYFARMATRKGNSYKELKAAFEADTTNAEIGLRLATVGCFTYEDVSGVMEKVYWRMPEEKKYTEDFFRLLFYVISPDSPVLADVMVHFGVIMERVGLTPVKTFATNYCVNVLLNAVQNGGVSIIGIERCAMFLGMLNLSPSDPRAYVGEMVLAYSRQDTDAMIRCVEQNFEKLPFNSLRKRLEGMMGYGHTPEQKKRIWRYYEAQAKLLESTQKSYSSILKHIDELK